MKGKSTQSGPNFEHGVYEVTLDEVQCYTAENFNTKNLEVNLCFVWNLGEDPNNPNQDLLYYDGFNTLYQDDEGYPVIGGKKGKMFKRFYGLYGEDFDPTEPELDWEIQFPRQYDDTEALLTMPMWNAYKKDDPRLKVKSIKIKGKELIGQQCQIELGHAQKPDGTYSTKTSVIDCKPLPRRRAGRNAPKRIEEPEEESLPV